MIKKIFAFVGSRSFRKTTYGFVENIILEIAKTKELEYEILTMNDVNIKPCTGCSLCFVTGTCWQKDDLALLKNKMLAADLIIIAAPVYMHGLPGEMKNIIDRLASWAHKLRLAGKDVLIASTCGSNGHTTVTDDLHLKMLHMGARIVGKYVGTNYIPDHLAADPEIDSHIMLLNNAKIELTQHIAKTIEKWDSPIITNKFNESLFNSYRTEHLESLSTGRITGETEYWVESGMINCDRFQDYIDKLLTKKVEENA